MNTRINPTVNGDCHLGHLYLALCNQYHAKSTGGTFSFIADDSQPCWMESVGVEQMKRYADNWLEDMAWMGITFDTVMSQKEMEQGNELRAAWQRIRKEYDYTHVPILAGSKVDLYPCCKWLTIEKVFNDHALGVDLLIRGVDLLPEDAQYISMWRDSYNTPPPQTVYLPRLQYARGEQIDTVSKTDGRNKIRTYREQGMTPEQIIGRLRRSCLIDPQGEWDWHNVKTQPILVPLTMPHTYTISHTWAGG